MPSYRQYCPIAKGAEVFADRWTPLIPRELLGGAEGFNQLHRGLPGISRSLLVDRLRSLENAGVLTHERGTRGRPTSYTLTAAGRELDPVVRGRGARAGRCRIPTRVSWTPIWCCYGSAVTSTGKRFPQRGW